MSKDYFFEGFWTWYKGSKVLDKSWLMLCYILLDENVWGSQKIELCVLFPYDFIWAILRLIKLVITLWECPHAPFHMHLCMRPSKCASQTNNLFGSNYHSRYQYMVVQTLCKLYTNKSEYEGETSISLRILLLFHIRTLQLLLQKEIDIKLIILLSFCIDEYLVKVNDRFQRWKKLSNISL